MEKIGVPDGYKEVGSGLVVPNRPTIVTRDGGFIKRGRYFIERYAEGQVPGVDRPQATMEFVNAYMNEGSALLLDLLIGAGGTAYNNANATIGVGDSSTAVSAAHTNLQAATNKLRKGMDATYPSRASQTVTWRATFGSSEANFAWNEVALFNHITDGSGKMLSRIVQSLGTKASGTTWVVIYTITLP